MKKLINEIFNKNNLVLNEKQCQQFDSFFNILIEENKKFNLTRITEKNEVATKHFLDSVSLAKFIPKNSFVVDIGAGAGFPSIPLKIFRPDISIIMVDSLNKRVNFLNETTNKLQLENISATHARAEDFAHANREKFDFAIARAVAPLNTLCELCLPLVKVGGMFLASKSVSANNELVEAKNAIKILGGSNAISQTINFSNNDMTRNIVQISKTTSTPSKYPRPKNLPKLKPL